MKFSPTTQKPFKWLFAFLLAFCFFSINGLQAQEYVSSSVAKQRLSTRVNQLDQQVAQGTITQLDHSINIRFLKAVVNGIEKDDYVWSAELSDKLTQVYENVLNSAQASTAQDFPQQTNKINTIKGELDTLLQQ